MNIEVDINGEKIPVIINRKRVKNLYLRFKDDLKIYVTAPLRLSDKDIEKFISNNEKFIIKSYKEIKDKKKRISDKFLLLGNSYDICYINEGKIKFVDNRVYMPRNMDLDHFYKYHAKKIFKEHLDYCYDLFEEKIPYPDLAIRKMKTRWGVCNVTLKKVTLNLELMKLNTKYLNYVIFHELAHFIYANHSREFWNIVSKYVPNYKVLRKEMKNSI